MDMPAARHTQHTAAAPCGSAVGSRHGMRVVSGRVGSGGWLQAALPWHCALCVCVVEGGVGGGGGGGGVRPTPALST